MKWFEPLLAISFSLWLELPIFGLPRFETSAKRNTGIEEACKFIVNHIVENDLRPAKEKSDLLPIAGKKDEVATSECMC